MIINNRAELEALDDGTIITWLRIPGDRTSEAVAFIRKQREWSEETPADPLEPRAIVEVTWISPGGWSPMAIEAAGINFPVVAFTDPSRYDELDVPTLDYGGGTWPREAALAAAARIFQGLGMEGRSSRVAGYVTDTADIFVDWLSRDTLAESLNETAATTYGRDLTAAVGATPEKFTALLDGVRDRLIASKAEMGWTVGVCGMVADSFKETFGDPTAQDQVRSTVFRTPVPEENSDAR